MAENHNIPPPRQDRFFPRPPPVPMGLPITAFIPGYGLVRATPALVPLGPAPPLNGPAHPLNGPVARPFGDSVVQPLGNPAAHPPGNPVAQPLGNPAARAPRNLATLALDPSFFVNTVRSVTERMIRDIPERRSLLEAQFQHYFPGVPLWAEPTPPHAPGVGAGAGTAPAPAPVAPPAAAPAARLIPEYPSFTVMMAHERPFFVCYWNGCTDYLPVARAWQHMAVAHGVQSPADVDRCRWQGCTFQGAFSDDHFRSHTRFLCATCRRLYKNAQTLAQHRHRSPKCASILAAAGAAAGDEATAEDEATVEDDALVGDEATVEDEVTAEDGAMTEDEASTEDETSTEDEAMTEDEASTEYEAMTEDEATTL